VLESELRTQRAAHERAALEAQRIEVAAAARKERQAALETELSDLRSAQAALQAEHAAASVRTCACVCVCVSRGSLGVRVCMCVSCGSLGVRVCMCVSVCVADFLSYL
jgi:hypothetical protein